jgi:hypothetical protein
LALWRGFPQPRLVSRVSTPAPQSGAHRAAEEGEAKVVQLWAQNGRGTTTTWHGPDPWATEFAPVCREKIRTHSRLHWNREPQEFACRFKSGKKTKKMLKMKVDPDELLKNKWTKIVICR